MCTYWICPNRNSASQRISVWFHNDTSLPLVDDECHVSLINSIWRVRPFVHRSRYRDVCMRSIWRDGRAMDWWTIHSYSTIQQRHRDTIDYGENFYKASYPNSYIGEGKLRKKNLGKYQWNPLESSSYQLPNSKHLKHILEKRFERIFVLDQSIINYIMLNNNIPSLETLRVIALH